ncbi:MAG: 30S ribosomal protein S20 [Gemmatimonadales bacterium]|nr:MAG: 30S ribosomal protein S20 [Gemmatimonadales bacterium]
MPNIKSAQKRMELSRKWQARNRVVRSRIRTAIKRVRQAEDAETATERLRTATALLDRAAGRRQMHPNRAARLKRQLQLHVNGLKNEA